MTEMKDNKKLGFREWQWKYGKNLGDRLDEIAWRRYYFKKERIKGGQNEARKSY